MKFKACMKIVMILTLMLFSMSVIAGETNLKPRPFWGSFEGEVSFPLTEACKDVTGVPFQTVSGTNGQMTHMGRTTLVTTHCSTPDGGAAVDGHAIFTAANGDEVWADYYALTVQPPPYIEQDITMVINGGTGRFQNASGNLQGRVYIEFQGFADPGWPIEFFLTGSIIY